MLAKAQGPARRDHRDRLVRGPERRLTNADLEAMDIGTNDEWIMERTGIRERRIAADDQALSDICRPAAEQALAAAGVSARPGVELLVVATVTPDMAFPSTGALLADAMGMTEAGAYDLSAGCAGLHVRRRPGVRVRRRRAGRPRARRGRRRPLADHGLDRSRELRALRRRGRRDGARARRQRRLPRLRARSRRLGRARAVPPGGRLAASRQRRHDRGRPALRADERTRGVQVRDADPRVVGGARAGRVRADDRRGRRLRAAPGERPDHRARAPETRGPGGEGRRQRRPLRQHLVRLDPACACRCAGLWHASGRRSRADDGNGRRIDVGLRSDRVVDAHPEKLA